MRPRSTPRRGCSPGAGCSSGPAPARSSNAPPSAYAVVRAGTRALGRHRHPAVRGPGRIRTGCGSGTVVAAVSLAPYENTARDRAGRIRRAVGVLVLLMVAVARAAVDLARARPVGAHDRAGRGVERARTLDRRFDLGRRATSSHASPRRSTPCSTASRAACATSSGFSAELSHELRTPLARVIAEAAARAAASPAAGRAPRRIRARAWRARSRWRGRSTRWWPRPASSSAHRTAPATRRAAPAARRGAVPALAQTRGISINVDEPAAPIRIGVDERRRRARSGPADRERVPVRLEHGPDRDRSARRRGAVPRARRRRRGWPAEDRERIFEPGWRAGRDGRERRRCRTWAGARPAARPRRRRGRSVGGNGRGGEFAARLPAG